MFESTKGHSLSPRDRALTMLGSETREAILRLDTERGSPSLLHVMAARYAERNGSGSEQDYLDSVEAQEGIVMPAGKAYAQLLGHFDQLIGKTLPSDLRERLEAGDQTLPGGTFMHALRFNPDVLTTIALTGVVARDFSPDLEGDLVNDDMSGCAYFFQTPGDSTVAAFVQDLGKSPMAQKVLPGGENGADSVAILFDTRINDPDYQALLAAQSADYEARPKAWANNAVAIPVGLPAGAIAGFILGEGMAADQAKQNHIQSLFPGIPCLATTSPVRRAM